MLVCDLIYYKINIRKGGIFIIQEKILQEINYLTSQIEELKSKLATMPDGKLICAKSRKSYKWYKSDGHEKVYIHKSEEKLASALAEKKYLSYLLEDLIQEKRALEMYVRHQCPTPGKAEQLLIKDPECRRLLLQKHTPKSKIIKEWLNEPYRKNPYNNDKLIHKGASGNYYRSKSEELIDVCLTKNSIPFRYECELVLPTGTVYPDFTILNPRTLKIYYFEHFGMMDDPKYAARACEKIKTYCLNGIYPNESLIMGFETKEHSMPYEQIEKLVQEYFT